MAREKLSRGTAPFVVLVLLHAASCSKQSPTPLAADPVVRALTSGQHGYEVVTVDLNLQTLQLRWKRPDGSRIGSLQRLESDIGQSGQRLVFAANAGIFDEHFQPLGLHVEARHELVPLNTGSGEGNFFLKPNGVFAVRSGRAQIVKTEDWRSDGADLAVQSGPMLLIDGRINPAFGKDSRNRYVRSGVGVDADSPSRVYFVLSQEPVNLHEFSLVFRDELGCRVALYLDGGISSFRIPATAQPGKAQDYAAMFVITSTTE